MNEFIWTTQDGRKLRPVDIETDHLINIISYIWNHIAAAFTLEYLPNPTVGPGKGFATSFVLEIRSNPGAGIEILKIMIDEYRARGLSSQSDQLTWIEEQEVFNNSAKCPSSEHQIE